MELDEAIKHCHEKAKELREQPLKEKMDIEDIASCEECAEEHEQLAEWLEELKEWKSLKLICGNDGIVVFRVKE